MKRFIFILVATVLVSCGIDKNKHLEVVEKCQTLEKELQISKDSVLYAVQTASPSSAITITLHPDAYARFSNDADVVAALEAQPLVSLVSA